MKFCLCEFGRDDTKGENWKRKKTKNIKFYKQPWRSNNMNCHVEEQHRVQYDEFVQPSGEDKKLFKVQEHLHQ
jgi:hypothetical protein